MKQPAPGMHGLRASRMRSYLEGVASGLLAKVVPVAVGLWLTPYVLGRVGREAFGLYALASSLMAWLALLDLGLTPGLKAYLARCSARPVLLTINRLVSSTLFPQFGIALAVLLGGVVGARSVPKAFGVSGALANQAAGLVVLLAAAVAVSLATQSFQAVLVAQQHLKNENLARLALVGTRAATVFVLLWRWPSLIAIGLAHLAGAAVSATWNVVWARRLTPGLRTRPSLVSWRELKPVAGTGAWFSVGAAAGLLISGADRIVAGKLVSLDAVTALTVTASAYVFAEAALSQLINSARPALGQLFGENSQAAVQRTYRQMLIGGAGLGLIAASSIWAANEVFVGTWVGPEHYGGLLLDTILGCNCVLALAILPSRAVLAAHLTVRPQTLARLVEGGINFVLSVWLTSRIGLVGTAFSTSLAALATSFWYLPRLTLRVLGQDWASIRDVGRSTAVFLALLLPAAWLGRTAAASVGGFPGAVTGGAFTAACGLALFWTRLLDAPVRRRLVAETASMVLGPRRAAAPLGAGAGTE